MNIERIVAALTAMTLALAAFAANAAFQIDEIYSNADGAIQYVVLRETGGQNGDNHFAGRTLTMTHGVGTPAAVTKTFTFPADLPSAGTAGKRVLVATPGFVDLGLIAPDYVMPQRFIATDGGTLTYSGGDSFAYPPLPSDGVSAQSRTVVTANIAINFAGQSASAPALPVTVVEFYNGDLDHYFISGLAPDLDALDSGRFSGWARTGLGFKAFPNQSLGGPGTTPACRYYIPPQHGDSHFISASPAECAAVAAKIPVDPNYSGYLLETSAEFYIALPDLPSEVCPAGTVPVYRLWNQRADSNHRYTTDAAIKQQMIARGYHLEGVTMCTIGAVGVVAPITASGASPFDLSCDGVPATGTLYVNAEVEPYIAVNPQNGNNVIGVWQQDRWSNGGARALATGASFDGGRTWSRSFAPFSRCSGGTAANGGDYARVSDPWVAIRPDGIAFQVAIAFTGQNFTPASSNAVLVSRSDDGGRNWSAPVTIIQDGASAFNDKESIAADPTDPHNVFVVWDRLTTVNTGPTYFSRTIDGGGTWETARPIYDPGAALQTINNQIVVLPDGTLVLFFTRFNTSGPANPTMFVMRSADKGLTWSPPITVAAAQTVGAQDPQTGAKVRDGTLLGSIAAGRNGVLAAVWQDARFTGGARDAIAFSRSLDGGLSWSPPVAVNVNLDVAAFVPAVSIADDGTYGVTYYDFRSNTSSVATSLTDYWLARSTDGLAWREMRIANPFDIATAPVADGYFLGDYQGLATAGSTFLPFFALATGGADNRADVAIAVSGGVSTAKALEVEVQARAAPPLQITSELEQRISDNVKRTMEARVPGWSVTRGLAPAR
jgi:hypothetical protein